MQRIEIGENVVNTERDKLAECEEKLKALEVRPPLSLSLSSCFARLSSPC